MRNIFSLDQSSPLSNADSVLIDSLEIEIEESYNTFIENLCIENKLSSISLLLSNTVRNVYTSGTYTIFSRILLLDKKVKLGQLPDIIFVPSQEVKEIVNQIVGDIEIPIEIKKNGPITYIKILKNFAVSLYLQLLYYSVSRILSSKDLPKKPIIYLDIFTFKDSFIKDHGFDRYYTGYEEFLSKEEKSVIWYSPTIIDIKSPFQLFNLWRGQKASKSQIICEEVHLSFFDYIRSISISLSLWKKIKKIPNYLNYEVDSFLRNELKKDICSPGLVKALNKYTYIKNLCKKIEVTKVINWHENQDIDRALILSFKEFSPDTEIYGYQGYVSPRSDLHKTPTDFEFKLGTLPDTLGVISSRDLIYKSKLCPNQKFEIAPALRFSYLYSFGEQSDYKDNFKIFVPLPAELKDAKRIVIFCDNLAYEYRNKYKFLFKIHPKYTFNELQKLIPQLRNPLFLHANEHVKDSLYKALIVLSASSSACVEAYSIGIPVAILSNSHGLTMNPIQDDDKKYLKLIYEKKDLTNFLNAVSDLSIKPVNLEEFFHKTTREEVRKIFIQ